MGMKAGLSAAKLRLRSDAAFLGQTGAVQIGFWARKRASFFSRGGARLRSAAIGSSSGALLWGKGEASGKGGDPYEANGLGGLCRDAA